MLLEAYKQVQLGVLLDLDSQLVEALYRGIAGKEVLRSWSECDYLEVPDADNCAGNGNELSDLLCSLLCCDAGIVGDIGADVSHSQVVGTVEHSAVGIAAAVDQISVSLCRAGVHHRAFELLGNQGLRRFRAEVAKEDYQSIAAVFFYIIKGFQGIVFILNCNRALIEAFSESLYHGRSSCN